MPQLITARISSQLQDACTEEATRTFPLETGGTFMGWWVDDVTAVISAMIGPGPEAVHERHNFAPDQAWQLAKIADHYKASDQRETYLGDWHSHPNASCGRLSWTDCRVLRRIIHSPEARCDQPLMAIFWGEIEAWQTDIYRGNLQSRSLIWDRLFVEPVQLHMY